MGFLSPLFLVGAIAAAIPVALHLLRQRTETRVRFSAVSMLREGPVEGSRQRRLRELLLMALRVTALVLLALAFARPYLKSRGPANPELAVVAVDASLSMSAPGQFDRAKTLARQAIDGAPGGEAVAVIVFSDTAQVLVPPTSDRAIARAAVDAAKPGFGATDYGAALAAASETLSSHHSDRGDVVVVTDLQESGWKARGRGLIPDGARLRVADVGSPPPNLAVTVLRVNGGQLVATIHSNGASATNANVHLKVDGREVARTSVSVDANGSSDVAFQGVRGIGAEVSVDDPTGIPGDNSRFVALENAGAPTLLVVTASGDLQREAFYAEQALVVPSDGRAAYRPTGIAASALGSESARLDEAGTVLLLSTRGLDQRGREALRNVLLAGGSMLVAAGDEVDGSALEQVLASAAFHVAADTAAGEPRTLALADSRHPMFQAFGAQGAVLGLVTFTRAARIEGKACQPLATFTTGAPALLDCAVGKGKALVFASDFGNRGNDFPLHATFVPFLHEALRYLTGGAASQREYLVADAPPGTPPAPGLRTVPDRSGRVNRTVAVNVDPTESDARRLSVAAFEAAVGRTRIDSAPAVTLDARQREEGQRLWQYATGLVLAVLVMEGAVARSA